MRPRGSQSPRRPPCNSSPHAVRRASPCESGANRAAHETRTLRLARAARARFDEGGLRSPHSAQRRASNQSGFGSPVEPKEKRQVTRSVPSPAETAAVSTSAAPSASCIDTSSACNLTSRRRASAVVKSDTPAAPATVSMFGLPSRIAASSHSAMYSSATTAAHTSRPTRRAAARAVESARVGGVDASITMLGTAARAQAQSARSHPTPFGAQMTTAASACAPLCVHAAWSNWARLCAAWPQHA